jgi:hypothetical protein
LIQRHFLLWTADQTPVDFIDRDLQSGDAALIFYNHNLLPAL